MRQSVRQIASGLLYAVISLSLVIGSLALALVEPNTKRARSTATELAGHTQESTTTSTSATTTIPTTVTPISVTIWFPTKLIPPAPTPTAKPTCGPLLGWIHVYLVQPGDTLFHIAMMYGISSHQLQQANCKQSPFIYPGELLWVPNVPTITPGITVIPTFDTPSETPSELDGNATSSPYPTSVIIETTTLDP